MKYIVAPRQDEKQQFDPNKITHCCKCEENPRYCGDDIW